jgi:hypothetical protein
VLSWIWEPWSRISVKWLQKTIITHETKITAPVVLLRHPVLPTVEGIAPGFLDLDTMKPRESCLWGAVEQHVHTRVQGSYACVSCGTSFCPLPTLHLPPHTPTSHHHLTHVHVQANKLASMELMDWSDETVIDAAMSAVNFDIAANALGPNG